MLQAKETRLLNYKLEKEKKEKILRKEAYIKVVEDEARDKERERVSFINQLANADTEEQAESLLAQVKREVPDTGIRYAAEVSVVMDQDELLEDVDDGFEEELTDPMESIYTAQFILASNYVDP